MKVNVTKVEREITRVELGDVVKILDGYYIVCREYHSGYFLINLETGQAWDTPRQSLSTMLESISEVLENVYKSEDCAINLLEK